jgi:dTDP-4-amino-4,6-dideoxy-D-galactose acyltransferase
MKVEMLKWDSDFFGIKTGRIFLGKENEWDEKELKDWGLLYVFVDPNDINTNLLLQKKQVPLVDEKVTYLMNVSNMKTAKSDLSPLHSYFSSEKDDEVIRIGVQSGVYSRFYVDQEIPRTKFLELYTIWMKRSINREMADEVIVYKTGKNEIAGVISIGEKNKRADIGIVAVDEHFRGRDIGRALLQGAVNYSIRNGYTFLQVVTQKKNEIACKFYERCGFKEESIINIYHFRNS